MKLDELREQLLETNTEANELKAKVEAEKRDLSVEEFKHLGTLVDSVERITEEIALLEKLEAQTEKISLGQGRKTSPAIPEPTETELENPDQPQAPRKNRGLGFEPVRSHQRNGGFRSLGEMAWHVRHHCKPGGYTDPRLSRMLAAASTYGNESTGADGGFAVPPDFRDAIMETVLGEDSLASRCNEVQTDRNTFSCPMDETTPWGTAGIQAYWGNEATAITQSKPALKELSAKVNRLNALVPMTEELLEDAPAMDAYLRRKAPEMINFKLNLAILQGTGGGQPLGLLNSPALVTVSKFASQTADTLTAGNVIDMYSRMYAPCRGKAVWLINQAIEPSLMKMSLPGTDSVGNAVTGWGGLVYMPAGGLSGAPFGTLFGCPVIPTQACETLGDKGDIFFADLSQYLLLLKTGTNPRVDVSMHLWFDQSLTAFKFTLRVGGMPWWSTTVAARDGSNTYSPYVTLEAR